jgi:hypothetical protein
MAAVIPVSESSKTKRTINEQIAQIMAGIIESPKNHKTPYNSPILSEKINTMAQCDSDSDVSQSSFENISEETHTNIQTDHL